MNKLMLSGLIGTGLALAGVLPAHADDVAMRPYISESLMYTFADDSRHSDGGIGGMLGGGVPINRFLNLELDGGYSHFNANSDDDSSPGANIWPSWIPSSSIPATRLSRRTSASASAMPRNS